MAKIWPVYEGKEPTVGGPWADISISEAIALFELRPDDFISVSAAIPRPRFGDVNRDLLHAGFKHVVVEIERDEGLKAKWKAGFYKTRITPKEAFRRLIQQPVVAELGKDNVLRVEHEPTTDSQGRSAIKITVVIAPDATKKLANGAVLDALVRLQTRLREMGVDRTPIIEYATEAELLQDGGP
jgi:hypothetical protein